MGIKLRLDNHQFETNDVHLKVTPLSKVILSFSNSMLGTWVKNLDSKVG